MICLKDKNIIITGASSGIGKACAIECSKAGAIVHIIGRDDTSLASTFSLLSGQGHSMHICDLSKHGSSAEVISTITSQCGIVSGFVHSAGFQITKPARSMNRQEYFDLYQTNAVSAFDIVKELSKSKKFDPAGSSVVFISSIMSFLANPGLAGYCASKAALVAGAKALALELAPKKIRVNCIAPGFIEDTTMMSSLLNQLSEAELSNLKQGYPLGLGESNDVANLCLFLLSDVSRWITGQNIVIDGGYSIK